MQPQVRDGREVTQLGRNRTCVQTHMRESSPGSDSMSTLVTGALRLCMDLEARAAPLGGTGCRRLPHRYSNGPARNCIGSVSRQRRAIILTIHARQPCSGQRLTAEFIVVQPKPRDGCQVAEFGRDRACDHVHNSESDDRPGTRLSAPSTLTRVSAITPRIVSPFLVRHHTRTHPAITPPDRATTPSVASTTSDRSPRAHAADFTMQASQPCSRRPLTAQLIVVQPQVRNGSEVAELGRDRACHQIHVRDSDD